MVYLIGRYSHYIITTITSLVTLWIVKLPYKNTRNVERKAKNRIIIVGKYWHRWKRLELELELELKSLSIMML